MYFITIASVLWPLIFWIVATSIPLWTKLVIAV
jgi:hypothetical protein